jgi:hypothetical protein
MQISNAVDKKSLSKINRRAIKEVGLPYYLEYQYFRNKLRAKKYMKRAF